MIKAMWCCSNTSFPKCKLFWSEFLFVSSCCKCLGNYIKSYCTGDKHHGKGEENRLFNLLNKLIKSLIVKGINKYGIAIPINGNSGR